MLEAERTLANRLSLVMHDWPTDARKNMVEWVEAALLEQREAGRRDRDPDIARLCNEIEELEVRCGLRTK